MEGVNCRERTTLQPKAFREDRSLPAACFNVLARGLVERVRELDCCSLLLLLLLLPRLLLHRG